MKNSFFQIANQNFFLPLTGVNREINVEILTLINEKMSDRIEAYEKKDIIEWIKEYLDNHPSYARIDDEDGQEATSDNRSYANSKVNYYIKYGWLISETSGFTQVLYMNSAGIAILKAMDDVVRNETKPIEYTGYVYNIHSILEHFDLTKSTALIEMLEKSANDFDTSLRSVNGSIKKYISSLLKDESGNAREILRVLLVDYHDNVVEKVFTNLRTGDNPARYRNTIIDKIDHLLNSNKEEIIQNYLATKKTEDRYEAEKYIVDTFARIRDLFDGVGEIIDTLNDKNEKYVQTANSRVQFLLNNDRNLEGKVYDVLRLFSEKDVGESDEFSFGIKELGKVNETSLYKYSKRKISGPVFSDYTKPKVDRKQVEEEKARIEQSLKYNVSSVDRWAMDQLGTQKEIDALSIPIENYNDLTILFLCIVYSSNEFVHYTIHFTGDSKFISFNKSRLDDFIIRRKIHE